MNLPTFAKLLAAFGVVRAQRNVVTGRITKYAGGVMIETTVTVTEYAALVAAGTIVAGCTYNVIPDA